MVKRTIINGGRIDDANDTYSKGVYELNDGTFLAMTWTQSKHYKTEKGAIRAYNKMTGKA